MSGEEGKALLSIITSIGATAGSISAVFLIYLFSELSDLRTRYTENIVERPRAIVDIRLIIALVGCVVFSIVGFLLDAALGITLLSSDELCPAYPIVLPWMLGALATSLYVLLLALLFSSFVAVRLGVGVGRRR